MVLERTFPIAPRGRATSFTEAELPVDYASEFKNRFINAAGGAEKRQGLRQLGSDVPGAPTLTGIHELVKPDGSTLLLVSGAGKIWQFDGTDYIEVRSGLDSNDPLFSVQFDDRLIFANGIDRNLSTKDGTTFEELRAIINAGEMATADTLSFSDPNVTNWVDDTDVAVNDVVFNRSRDAYGVITAVTTATITHTNIGVSATGIGFDTVNQATGDRYEILDLVELNIVPTDGDDDNVATGAVGTSASRIIVSAVTDWTTTEVRVGDFIRNTTRTAVTQVTSISTGALGVIGIAAQTDGDSLVLLKSAMPISSNLHTHFGRLFHIDSRDRKKIRISGANSATDMTNGATLDASTFTFGGLQPEGDVALAMTSYQRFFVIAGRQNVFFYSGTDPLDESNFQPIGLFPQGAVSEQALLSIGNDAAFVTPDGVQTVSLVGDASTLGRANISEAIKTTLRDEIEAADEDTIVTVHYPRRSWFLVKIGTLLHCFNYTAFFGVDQLSARAAGTLSTQTGSWSLFDGKFARQRAYLVRQNGDLVCCGSGGKVYEFDKSDFDDDGEGYQTQYRTGWLFYNPRRPSVRVNQGKYIKPLVDVGQAINYTIRAEGEFDNVESSDTVTVSAAAGEPVGLAVVGEAAVGGSSIENVKYPLHWRGETVRFTFETDDQTGPDVISRYTVYYTRHGKR